MGFAHPRGMKLLVDIDARGPVMSVVGPALVDQSPGLHSGPPAPVAQRLLRDPQILGEIRQLAHSASSTQPSVPRRNSPSYGARVFGIVNKSFSPGGTDPDAQLFTYLGAFHHGYSLLNGLESGQ